MYVLTINNIICLHILRGEIFFAELADFCSRICGNLRVLRDFLYKILILEINQNNCFYYNRKIKLSLFRLLFEPIIHQFF